MQRATTPTAITRAISAGARSQDTSEPSRRRLGSVGTQAALAAAAATVGSDTECGSRRHSGANARKAHARRLEAGQSSPGAGGTVSDTARGVRDQELARAGVRRLTARSSPSHGGAQRPLALPPTAPSSPTLSEVWIGQQLSPIALTHSLHRTPSPTGSLRAWRHDGSRRGGRGAAGAGAAYPLRPATMQESISMPDLQDVLADALRRK